MTLIAEGGARTLTNGTVYDRRKVYEITAIVVADVCRSNLGGEVERTGQTVTEPRVYHVLAKNDACARALYETNWGSEFQRHTLIAIKPLFVIDGEISNERG